MSESSNADEKPNVTEQDLTLPADGDRGGQSGQAHERPRPSISRQEILAKLAHLPTCVALGILTPQCANAMRAAYATILANLGPDTSHGSATVSDDGVLEILRVSPAVLKQLEPFLTPEQVALVMHESTRER